MAEAGDRLAPPRSIPSLAAVSAAGRDVVARDVLVLVAVSLGAALAFYLPYVLGAPVIDGYPLFHRGMNSLYGMWDGPLYVTAAATLWDTNPANPLFGWYWLNPRDYAERFPLYPLTIRLLSPVLGYWNGSLFVNVVASTAASVLIYFLVRRFGSKDASPLWVAIAAMFWPPRAFLYRYTPLAEPLTLVGVVGTVYFFRSERFWLAGLFGLLFTTARPSSPVLVAGFGILALARLWRAPAGRRMGELWRMRGLLLMPLALAAIYAWHYLRYGDWLASVHSADFVAPVLQLYPSLRYYGPGAEVAPYVFTLALVGIFELARRRHWDLVLLCAVVYVPALFIPTDVGRYLIPILPLALFLAGDRVVSSVPARIGLILSLLLIYLYCWETIYDPAYQAPFGTLRMMLP